MIESEIALQPATPDDTDFLKVLFASTRSDELNALARDPKQVQAFVDMQFIIQQANYRACYPSAENTIILLGEEAIGRMLVDRATETFVLVDIAIVNKWRNKGIGSFLIRRLMDEAAALQKPVRLSVFKLNPALRLYERLGFSIVHEDGVYSEMKWIP